MEKDELISDNELNDTTIFSLKAEIKKHLAAIKEFQQLLEL